MKSSRWVQLFRRFPQARQAVFRGLPSGDEKIGAQITRPPASRRLVETFKGDLAFFQSAADVWADDNLEILALLDMLDRNFLRDNLMDLKDLIGPERLVLSLYFLEDALEDLAELLGREDFWTRGMDERLGELFIPIRSVLQKAVEEVPESAVLFSSLGFVGPGPGSDRPVGDLGSAKGPPRKGAHAREVEKRKRLEARIEKLKKERAVLISEKERLLGENAGLKHRLQEWEKSFQEALERGIAEEKKRWYSRYQALGDPDWKELEKTSRRLDQLFVWADRAFACQRQADERYGLIGEVRQKLLKIELHLQEIERIFAQSLMVHPEVRRLKKALLQERQRVLGLPGVEKALKGLPADLNREGLLSRLRLLEPNPRSLGALKRLERALRDLEETGVLPDLDLLLEEVNHKRRQILEALYGRFMKEAVPKDGRSDWKNLEQFVASGESRRYTVYVDGYNILLRLLSSEENRGTDLADLRSDFIEAVQTKQNHFRKIVLVFDGEGDYSDQLGKVEIVYTDKTRGTTADLYILQAVRRSKDRKILLVTEDREIIEGAGARVFALIRPLDFYSYVHDLSGV